MRCGVVRHCNVNDNKKIMMFMFKRLSLKALSALQDHEGGGGDGVTKIITQMFLSDSA